MPKGRISMTVFSLLRDARLRAALLSCLLGAGGRNYLTRNFEGRRRALETTATIGIKT
jgi:hypothetical protein